VSSQHGPYYPPADSSPTGVEENLPETRREKIMSGIRYDDNPRLNLMPNVIYVMLKDPSTGTIMGKIISISGNSSFKPKNDPAALLLYLLSRDMNDGILFSKFADLARQKFTPPPSDTVLINFLDKLDDDYNILHADYGKSTGNDDPLNLFDPPTATWETPDLDLGNQPICKANTFYSSGWIAVPIRR
jgi:hypothetical protein